MRGIEPPYAAWEAAVLPLNYIRVANQWLPYNPGSADWQSEGVFSRLLTLRVWADQIRHMPALAQAQPFRRAGRRAAPCNPAWQNSLCKAQLGSFLQAGICLRNLTDLPESPTSPK